MAKMLSGLSTGEVLMLGGSLLLIVGDLLFTIFLDYDFSQTAWLGAVVAAVLIAVHLRPSGGLSVPTVGYRLALIIIGVVVGLTGVRWLLFDLQIFSGRIGVTFLLGALAFYVGVALMAVGAFLVWSRRSG